MNHVGLLCWHTTENPIRPGLSNKEKSLTYINEKSRRRAGSGESKPPADLALTVSPVFKVVAVFSPDSTQKLLGTLGSLPPGEQIALAVPHLTSSPHNGRDPGTEKL